LQTLNKEAVASSIWLLFFLLECDSKLTHYHPNWLNFNSDNYPDRGGNVHFIIVYGVHIIVRV
ncbi:hypothetical protein BOO24_20625, partial [Vibrio navarrensis]|nr:hypothetical protein [Vibrio navarrensis]